MSSPTNAEKVVVMAKTLKEKTPSKICPAKTPFYKKSTASCVSCPADQYFNYDTDTCVPCATPNSIDPNTQMCGLKVSGTHQTSLSSSNLALAGISMG